MNLAETTFINSTLRVRELRDRVGPDVLGRGSLHDVDRILEVGCGQGIGLLLLADRFPTAQLVGVDLDPGMIRRARRRVAALGDRVELRVDDLSSLPDPAGSFDVVVDFAAVHHVPDWRSALSEIARVLRPGGEFLFEDHDVTKHSWFARHFFAHPRGAVHRSGVRRRAQRRRHRLSETTSPTATATLSDEVHDNRTNPRTASSSRAVRRLVQCGWLRTAYPWQGEGQTSVWWVGSLLRNAGYRVGSSLGSSSAAASSQRTRNHCSQIRQRCHARPAVCVAGEVC